MRTLGVLGGMGPAATFDFCARLTAFLPARRDQDHPRILVDCDPHVPDRNAARRGEGSSPGPYLAAMARGLVSAGADLLCMPCNAAHAYRADIESAAPGLFVDMIEATAQAAEGTGARRVGVLAVDGCLEPGLYQSALHERGLDPVLLSRAHQRAFMEAVYAIKAGSLGPDIRASMKTFAGLLVDAGAQAIIAGCTEVPLALAGETALSPLIDCTQALVEAVAPRLRS
jgi:aspartate racemase